MTRLQTTKRPHLAQLTMNRFAAGIDVVSCADRQQAIQLAAAHPIARYQAIEVRPFYSE